MVPCGCSGHARTHKRDGASCAFEHERANAAFTVGKYQWSDAAITMAGSQHQRPDAALTLGEHQRSDASVSLVRDERIPQ